MLVDAQLGGAVDGRIVKLVGDGMLAKFPSVVDAAGVAVNPY